MSFLDDILAGLRARPRAIPAKWFYDTAGSALFDDITRLHEYYPTRVEQAILDRASPEIALAAGTGGALVEFGSGASVKTHAVLRALAPSAYVPVDISGDFLRATADALRPAFPQVTVLPVEADFTQAFALPPAVAGLARLGFFPGSTIGNFEPAAAVDLLRRMGASLGAGSSLLIGLDLVKDIDVLLCAYDDPGGVTAAFNLNLLTRFNRELGGTLPIDCFAHRVRWDAAASRVEMHLEATRDVAFAVAGESFAMAAGETIHTENSHKYTIDSARLLLRAGGWEPVVEWLDDDWPFAVMLASAPPAVRP